MEIIKCCIIILFYFASDDFSLIISITLRTTGFYIRCIGRYRLHWDSTIWSDLMRKLRENEGEKIILFLKHITLYVSVNSSYPRLDSLSVNVSKMTSKEPSKQTSIEDSSELITISYTWSRKCSHLQIPITSQARVSEVEW